MVFCHAIPLEGFAIDPIIEKGQLFAAGLLCLTASFGLNVIS